MIETFLNDAPIAIVSFKVKVISNNKIIKTHLHISSDDLVSRDPWLAFKVFLGPVTPYQYRLTGPLQWNGARQAIMSQCDRTREALQTRPLPSKDSMLDMQHLMMMGVLLIALFVFRTIWAWLF